MIMVVTSNACPSLTLQVRVLSPLPWPSTKLRVSRRQRAMLRIRDVRSRGSENVMRVTLRE